MRQYVPVRSSVSGGKSGFGYTYSWDFGGGDTSTLQNIVYSFSDTGSYNIELIITNACGKQDTAYKTITVVDTLQPFEWIYITPRNTCPGNEIKFIAQTGNASYFWNFGDGDTSVLKSAAHIYNSVGVYPVELTITNYCGNSIMLFDTVTIDSSIITPAEFYLEQYSYCPGEYVWGGITALEIVI